MITTEDTGKHRGGLGNRSGNVSPGDVEVLLHKQLAAGTSTPS
jgi:hypothetical protein